MSTEDDTLLNVVANALYVIALIIRGIAKVVRAGADVVGKHDPKDWRYRE